MTCYYIIPNRMVNEWGPRHLLHGQTGRSSELTGEGGQDQPRGGGSRRLCEPISAPGPLSPCQLTLRSETGQPEEGLLVSESEEKF
ncbi:hypothetical protein GOODEAATRI_014520 [Goodea atripinnis]|uniref:Uncharacterized protein n=1 Tax=Goodea atripinnis TaxID=208336 RepID=A0ABV0NVS9_9TELE